MRGELTELTQSIQHTLFVWIVDMGDNAAAAQLFAEFERICESCYVHIGTERKEFQVGDTEVVVPLTDATFRPSWIVAPQERAHQDLFVQVTPPAATYTKTQTLWAPLRAAMSTSPSGPASSAVI